MTLFDRALSKAYALRSAQLPESPTAPVPVARGWVARLRTPASRTADPVENPLPATEAPTISSAVPAAAIPTVPLAGPVFESDAGLPADLREDVVYPPDLVVRVDASHAAPVIAAELAGWSWPEISQKLLVSTAGPGLISLADTLESLSGQRRMRTIAISGNGRSTGRTTLLLTLARLLIERTPLRLLLVDFDFGNPCLAAAVGIRPAIDISHLMYDEAAGASAVSALIPERFGILPLCHPVAPSELTPERQKTLCDTLRVAASQYDLTLVDTGPWDSALLSTCLENGGIDAWLAVSRTGAADEALPDAIQRPGIEFLGTVETFVPAVPRNEPHFIR